MSHLSEFRTKNNHAGEWFTTSTSILTDTILLRLALKVTSGFLISENSRTRIPTKATLIFIETTKTHPECIVFFNLKYEFMNHLIFG